MLSGGFSRRCRARRPSKSRAVAPSGSSCRNASEGSASLYPPVLIPRASGAFDPRRCQADFHAAVGRDALPNRAVSVTPSGLACRNASEGSASLHPRLYSVAPPALSNQDVVRPDFHAAVGRDALPNRAVSVAPWGSSCRNASGGFRFAVLPVLLPRASGAFVPRRCQAGGAPEVQGKVDLPLPSCTVSTGAPESWNARGTCKPQRGAGVKPGVKRSGTPGGNSPARSSP